MKAFKHSHKHKQYSQPGLQVIGDQRCSLCPHQRGWCASTACSLPCLTNCWRFWHWFYSPAVTVLGHLLPPLDALHLMGPKSPCMAVVHARGDDSVTGVTLLKHRKMSKHSLTFIAGIALSYMIGFLACQAIDLLVWLHVQQKVPFFRGKFLENILSDYYVG